MKLFPLLVCVLASAVPTFAQSSVCDPVSSGTYPVPAAESPTRVALGGQYRVVADGQVNPAGVAYVFDLDGALLHELRPPQGVGNARFGTGLATDGTHLAVGAWGDSTQAPEAGAVYVYSLSTGQLLLSLFSPTPQSQGHFGIGVAMDQGLLLVGANGESPNGLASGAVHAFQLDTGQWLGTMVPNDGTASAAFGTSIALHTGIAAIGAPLDSEGTTSWKGSVYLFDTTTRQQIAKYREPEVNHLGRFGTSVDLDSQGLLVGSREDAIANASGALYLYDWTTGQRLHKLLQSDASSFDSFGVDCALEGGLIVGGCPGDNIHGPDSGSLYLFDRVSGQQLTKVFPSQGAAQDRFGQGLDLSGGRLLVGTAAFLGNDDDSGLALEFTTLLGAVNPFCTASTCPCGNSSEAQTGCLNSTGLGGRLSACGSTQVSSDDLVFQATGLPTSQFALLYMGSEVLELPFGDGLRCAGGNTFRFNPPVQTQAQGNAMWGPGIVATSCVQFSAAGCILPGATWLFQGWYRDPAGLCGFGFNTTDALAVTFQL